MKPRSRLIFALISSLALFGVGVTFSVAEEGENEYDRRAAIVRKLELSELIKLAGWCQKKGLERQARPVLSRIMELDPDNLKATTMQKGSRSSSARAHFVDADLHLTDGGRLRGKIRLRHVRLKTPYGTITFPPKSVSIIAFNVDGQDDVVVADGFTMGGSVNLGILVASTKMGSVKVDTNKLSRLCLLRQCPQCKGKDRITCARCKGKGRVTREFMCPVCNGEDSRAPCMNCNGTGRIVCRHCGGRGTWLANLGGFMVRHRCTYCKGRGWLRCKPCKGKGVIFCPRCNGTGKATELIECPECKGAKTVPCPACNSTGHMPVPELVWPILPERTDTDAVEAP